MTVRFTLEALTHIAGIHFFIQQASPRAAAHVVARIFAEADHLGEFPQLGRVGAVPGAYEWTVSGLPYIMVHEVDDDRDQLVVIGVFDGAQDR